MRFQSEHSTGRPLASKERPCTPRDRATVITSEVGETARRKERRNGGTPRLKIGQVVRDHPAAELRTHSAEWGRGLGTGKELEGPNDKIYIADKHEKRYQRGTHLAGKC